MASSTTIEEGAAYHVVVGGTNSNEDEFGYAEGGTLSGGTDSATVTAGTEAQGTMGEDGMFGGGMDGPMPGDSDMGGRPGAMPYDSMSGQDGTTSGQTAA